MLWLWHIGGARQLTRLAASVSIAMSLRPAMLFVNLYVASLLMTRGFSELCALYSLGTPYPEPVSDIFISMDASYVTAKLTKLFYSKLNCF